MHDLQIKSNGMDNQEYDANAKKEDLRGDWTLDARIPESEATADKYVAFDFIGRFDTRGSIIEDSARGSCC